MPNAGGVSTEAPIVIFDGVCGMCSRLVALALRHDRLHQLVFTPNQSAFGAALCEQLTLTRESQRTLIVVDNGRVLLRSDAVIFIARHLTPPYSFVRWIRVVPRPLRDLGYRAAATIRRLIPFNPATCALLPPELRQRIRE